MAEITPFLIWALSGSRIPLALGVLQILALDLGTDTLSATALGAEPAHHNESRSRPSRGRLLDREVAFRAFGLLGPTEAAVEMAAFFAVFLAAGWRPGETFPDSAVAAASPAPPSPPWSWSKLPMPLRAAARPDPRGECLCAPIAS